MQGQFSTDWFGHNVPQWEAWLGSMRGKPGIRAMEVGSFEGRSAIWLCENILTGSGSRIDCVDLFRDDPVYGDYRGRFRANTAPWRERITEHAGRSFDCLRQLDGPFDIVYIDGWHSAFGALADGVMSWPLLKVGGVMIFDDYAWAPPGWKALPTLPEPGKLRRKWLKWRGRSWRKEHAARERAMQERALPALAVETPRLGVDGMLATLAGYYEVLGSGYQLAIRKTRDFDQGQLGHDT